MDQDTDAHVTTKNSCPVSHRLFELCECMGWEEVNVSERHIYTCVCGWEGDAVMLGREEKGGKKEGSRD